MVLREHLCKAISLINKNMIKQHVKATNMDLTPAIDAYLADKVRLLEKFVPDEEETIARVEIGKTTNHHHKGDIFKAEINLHVGRKMFRVVIETDDLYKAIDQMKDEMIREITRAKEKRTHLLKRGHQKIKDMVRGFRDRF